MNLFEDNFSLIFLKSFVKYEDMTTSDYLSYDNVQYKKSDDKINYLLDIDTSLQWTPKQESFSEIEKNFKTFDLLVEVTYVKKSFGKISNSFNKEIQSLKIMTYDFISLNSENKLVEYAIDKRKLEKTETLTILPKKIIERNIDGKVYNLRLLVLEFIREQKLEDLGL